MPLSKRDLITDPVELSHYDTLVSQREQALARQAERPTDVQALYFVVWELADAYKRAAALSAPPPHLKAHFPVGSWTPFRMRCAKNAEAYDELLSSLRA